MSLELRVLGYAGGAPVQAACSAYVVASAQATILLDCGPGALERLWRQGLLASIDAVVISHMHADHVLDLVSFAGELVRGVLGPRRPELYVPAGNGRDVLGSLDAAFSRGVQTATRFDETFRVTEYGVRELARIGDLELTFAEAAHEQPCFAARVSHGDGVIVYGADGAPTDALVRLADDADLLVCEATFPTDLALAQASGH